MEEASLRAKIQAMKNLLAVNRAKAGAYESRAPVNRSWTRFPSPSAVNRGAASANKVWKREEAVVKPKNEAWKRPVKVASKPVAKRGKSMQLQVLRLEDGEYAKANGGFSLVRSGVKKSATTPSPTVPVSQAKDSVSIGGVRYVLANGGKLLKRCSVGEKSKAVTLTKQASFGMGAKSVAARAALARAKAAVQRSRTKKFKATHKAVKVRTEYCSFYNRFGFCKNKNACRFIHDSRRVAMCRKFLRNECNDPKCLLSHQNDENKVPVCKMFLRGSCTREGCKYRHVKVSATAGICHAFTKGYCPKGDACEFRHELPTKQRKASPASTPTPGQNGPSPKVSGTSSSCSISPMRGAGVVGCEVASSSSATRESVSASSLAGESSKDSQPELSIRPNIRFTPKHSAGFPSLFEGLRRAAK